jgi:hypothetical protein
LNNSSNPLAVSRWCARRSRPRRSTWMKIVDDGLESVGCWGGGAAGGLGHGDPGFSTGVCVEVVFVLGELCLEVGSEWGW